MNKIVIVILYILFVFVSCNEQKNNNKKLLIGIWHFEKGTMNGNKEDAELLQNLVFDFSEKTLKCELLPDMQKGFGKEVLYELSENQIIIGKLLYMQLIKVTKEDLFIKFEIKAKEKVNEYNLEFSRSLELKNS
ncbi:MAG: hypothetical protein MK207_05450 [Saprospiraceae bacterium]|nr:hypothetical protein [Saprospiraceae bacterium]